MERLDNEAGGHRIQRIPPTERRGRVHTSTVTVAVLVRDLYTQIGQPPSDGDFRVEWFSGSGAGGQHRNRHCNSCRITHAPTGLIRKAETRSRENSYREAMLALNAAIEARVAAEEHANTNATRAAMVGSGQRADKRRTYRFQDDIVVDHVTGRRAACSQVMRGMFDRLWP